MVPHSLFTDGRDGANFYPLFRRAAELLTSLSPLSDITPTSDNEDDSQMSDAVDPPVSDPIPVVVTSNTNPREARLEAPEVNKYLLAKSYFDCCEYDCCAAVFIPEKIQSSLNFK
jgi:anaphase-promoting complex subunit 8